MDSIEYVLALSKKIQKSFEDGEEMPWAERVQKAGDAVMEEEDES